ncbi:MAG TPA: hypothetical protein VK837_09940 [Longimicrobiales bacterium]|nr:hypothetical protein [Longimicrobiales bacterium]
MDHDTLTRRCVATGLAALLVAVCASCDLPRPAPVASDAEVQTYRWRTRTTMHVRRRSGDDTMRFGVDAVAAFQQITPDSAHGWVEEASGFIAAAGRRVESEPDFLLRRLFVLRRDDEGFLRSVERPGAPDELPPEKEFMRAMTEMFEDFVPRMPAGALEPGTTWTDTLRIVRTANRPRPQTYVKSNTYRIERDTVVSDARAWVIAYEGEIVREDAPTEDRLSAEGTIVADSSLVTLSMRGTVEGVQRGDQVAGLGAEVVEVEGTSAVDRIAP